MKNKKLIDEFNISIEDNKSPITSDYDVFSDDIHINIPNIST